MQVLRPITIYMDDHCAIFIPSDQVTSKCFKHVDTRNHMLRHCIAKGSFNLEHAGNEFKIGDMMTKRLEKVKVR